MSNIIITSNGHKILVDEEDYDELNKYEWIAIQKSRRGKYYASRRSTRVSSSGREYRYDLMMHRYIMDAPKYIHVHHINNDGLDNRKENLKLMKQEDHFKIHHINRNMDKSWMIGKTTPITDIIGVELRLLVRRVKRSEIRKYSPTNYIPKEIVPDEPYWLNNPKLELW